MKIEHRGVDPRKDRWWVGHRFTCAACGTRAILEEGDDVRDCHWPAYPSVDIRCPTCGGGHTVYLSDVPPFARKSHSLVRDW